MDIERKMKEWHLLESKKDRRLFTEITNLLFLEKYAIYRERLLKIVPSLWRDVNNKLLIDESECQKLIDEEENREIKILIADTYLHMKSGLQVSKFFGFNF